MGKLDPLGKFKLSPQPDSNKLVEKGFKKTKTRDKRLKK